MGSTVNKPGTVKRQYVAKGKEYCESNPKVLPPEITRNEYWEDYSEKKTEKKVVYSDSETVLQGLF